MERWFPYGKSDYCQKSESMLGDVNSAWRILSAKEILVGELADRKHLVGVWEKEKLVFGVCQRN